jgi:predicted nucleotidyltransferase
MLNVKAAELETIKKILKKHVPGAQVIAFGSRVAGTAVAHSDLDLAIKTDTAIPFSTLGNLKMDFEESLLSFRVDVADWNAISAEFRKIIQSRNVTIQ